MTAQLIDRIKAGLDPAGLGRSPLYLQLAAALRAQIELGALRGGDALPSERDLAQETGLSRVTVRKAIDALCADQLTERRHGAGTFVTRQIAQPLSVLQGFTEDMRRRGAVATSQLLRRDVSAANPSEMLKLGLAASEPVFRLSRVRLSDGDPLAIEHAVVPASAVTAETVAESLYDALRRSGNMPVRALQRLHAAVANATESRLLQVPLGSPVLRIERRSFLANGRPIEVTTSSYRGDRYDFIAELTLEP